MKEVGNTSWHDPFIGPGATNSSFVPATNSSLFSALPGGYRSEYGSYGGLNDTGNWWSTSLYSNDFYSIRTLSYLHDQASSSGMSKTYGLSVRCLRD